MASAQLKIVDLKTGAVAGDSGKTTSTLKAALSYDLSENSKVTAHPGDKWKSGYLTLSRVSKLKAGWRNVHLSKTSFEKLGKELAAFKQAFKDKTDHKVMLTKKQHVTTSTFKREGKETLYYVSIMHPAKDTEDLQPEDEINHGKTINLNSAEFDKFALVYESLAEVVKSKAATGENDDAAMIEGFRWTCRHTATRSSKIFLTLEDCMKDADFYYFHTHKDELQAQPMECDREANFDFFTISVEKASKLEIIEHLAYATLVRSMKNANVETDSAPPTQDDINAAIDQFDKAEFAALTRKVLMKLVYKNVYLTGELINIFMYYGGLEKVKSSLLKHTASCSGKLFTRVIDHCFDVVYEEMNKE